jgi:hypothetical protein
MSAKSTTLIFTTENAQGKAATKMDLGGMTVMSFLNLGRDSARPSKRLRMFVSRDDFRLALHGAEKKWQD